MNPAITFSLVGLCAKFQRHVFHTAVALKLVEGLETRNIFKHFFPDTHIPVNCTGIESCPISSTNAPNQALNMEIVFLTVWVPTNHANCPNDHG